MIFFRLSELQTSFIAKISFVICYCNNCLDWKRAVHLQVLKTFFVHCCLELYKLIPFNTTKGIQEGKRICRGLCSDNGMVPMPLNSGYDREKLAKLPEYEKGTPIITGAIEIVERRDRPAVFFSSAGGKEIFMDFESLTGPGIHSIILHSNEYHTEDYFYGDGLENFQCACKLPGERSWLWCQWKKVALENKNCVLPPVMWQETFVLNFSFC